MPGLNEHDITFLRGLQRGQTITGIVTEIAAFGVTFVDIGGFTAMINIPELSWRPIRHPGDVVAVGEAITAQILDIDLGRGRVSLSLKAPQPDPLIDLRRQIGSVVAGPVTKLVPFGAFLRVEDRPDGLEGLIHKAALAGRSIHVGDVLDVRLVGVDVARRRIDLAPVQDQRADP
ncbi:S1 RNA-binding domain-containing protein [Actinomadura sp. 1N219]|uniref:S1 RNA-binding domain-containing protein n=1 Tax=Actinomadura sp. 1N219 TaxID=3375152 RepID=UPI0037A8FB2B